MKKKIFCLLLILIMPLILFSGCVNAEKKLEEKSMFVVVEHLNIDGNCIIYVLVNKETKVMYITQYKGALIVMLNPDGTPMLWEGEL